MSLPDTLAFTAAIFTLLTFVLLSMITTRIAAIAANVCLIAFGVLAPYAPMLLLYFVLLPINLYQRSKLIGPKHFPPTRHCSAATSDSLSSSSSNRVADVSAGPLAQLP